MDVVADQGDQVIRSQEEHCPVVVAVTGGGPTGVSVEFVVRDGDSTGLGIAGDNHLTTDERELGMLMIIPRRNSKVEGYTLQ